MWLFAALGVSSLIGASARAETPPPSPSLGTTPTAAPTFSTTPVTFNVVGSVATGSPGISVPAGLPVAMHILHAVNGKFVESVTRNATIDAQNNYHFESVVGQPGDFGFVTTTFQNMTQGSPLAQLANDQKTLEAPITLYAVTNDLGAVQVERAQYIINFGLGNLMYVLVSYRFVNTSDHLFTSKDKAGDVPISVKIPLPVGAIGIAFNSPLPDRFVIGGDINSPIVEDTHSLLPGEAEEIVFSFQLPYDEKGQVPIDQDFPYLTKLLEILIPDDAHAGMSDPKLAHTPVGVEVTPNTSLNPKRPYTQYVVHDLKPGVNFVYFVGPGAGNVISRPAATSQTDPGTTLLFIGSVGLFVLGVAVFIQRWRLHR